MQRAPGARPPFPGVFPSHRATCSDVGHQPKGKGPGKSFFPGPGPSGVLGAGRGLKPTRTKRRGQASPPTPDPGPRPPGAASGAGPARRWRSRHGGERRPRAAGGFRLQRQKPKPWPCRSGHPCACRVRGLLPGPARPSWPGPATSPPQPLAGASAALSRPPTRLRSKCGRALRRDGTGGFGLDVFEKAPLGFQCREF